MVTRRRTVVAAVTLSAVLSSVLSLLGAAPPPPTRPHLPLPRTDLVSTAADGTRGDSRSISARVSFDGRYAAFNSEASNLVPGDTNNTGDVFVRDLSSGTLTRAGVSDDGRQSTDGSWNAALSGDGGTVGFDSGDPALAPGERPPGGSYAYVRDLRSGHTESIGIGPDGVPFQRSSVAALSGDGRYAAFFGYADIPEPPFSRAMLHLRDRERGTTELISEPLAPGPLLSSVSLSADGRHVAFRVYDDSRVSVASAVYVRDRRTGKLAVVNHTPGDPQPVSRWYGQPSLSADGRFIAYVTNRDGKPATHPRVLWEVFVHDLTTGRTVLAGTAPDGGPLDKAARSPRISPDGRHVAYTTGACATAEPDCRPAVYLRDLRQQGPTATQRVSVAADGGFPDHQADDAAPAWGGCQVAFESDATNLVPRHPERITDIYLRHLC
ncbi:TolB family protein [Streptomyces aureocirculatus]|uniref:TolB family protein n=1 Tax=Streptomyces aureocirculatus TaxID=67275 RepID=UPI0004C97C9A|nr:PD40 domain-containing protein [Streptomyces aureocirculatus]